jgi:hypothetical protein
MAKGYDRFSLPPGNMTFPDAQHRVEIGLTQPNENGLSGSRLGPTPLSRIESQGKQITEALKVEESLPKPLNPANVIVSPDERTSRDPRGIARVTLISSSLILMESAGQ